MPHPPFNTLPHPPMLMPFIMHSYAVCTSFLLASSTWPTKNVSFKSPWKPSWYTVTSTSGDTHTHNITHSLISSRSWIWKNFRMKFFKALFKLQLILIVDISFKTGQPYPKLISLALSLGLITSFFFPTTSSYPLNSYLPLQMSPSFNSLASGMPWQITSFTDLKNTMTSQWHHRWNGATGIVKWWKIDWWMISESGAGEGEDRNGPDSP